MGSGEVEGESRARPTRNPRLVHLGKERGQSEEEEQEEEGEEEEKEKV